jgi:hypothetical protein
MLVSEKLAIAAHLHVLLRRKTGRVTDTEWMAANAEYAAEIVRFCRSKATEDGHAELGEWAGKLEAAVQPARAARPPRAEAAMQLLEPVTPSAPPARAAPAPNVPRYIGGIR